MFHKIALIVFGVSALTLTACDDVTGTPSQAMTPDETGIITSSDNDDATVSVSN